MLALSRRLFGRLSPPIPAAEFSVARDARTAVTAVATYCPGRAQEGPQPMSRFGLARTNLAKVVALVLDEMPSNPRYFLDNGTLLGLWRDGALIENDDDFDFGLLVDGSEFSAQWMLGFQQEFQRRLENVQHPGEDFASNTPARRRGYHSRVIDTYAKKIEVYDPALGSFTLRGARYKGARYHHVSVDLQMHVVQEVDDEDSEDEDEDSSRKDGEDAGARLTPTIGHKLVREISRGRPVLIASGKVLTTGRGVSIQHLDFETRGQAPGNVFEPFGSVHYAGKDWPVPGEQKMYLSYLYGYLGIDAIRDTVSMLYRKRLVPGVAVKRSDGKIDETVLLSKPRVLRLYTDMCADLFHTGHVNYLRQCRAVAEHVFLVVGIHSDKTIESYKRSPICTMTERVSVVEACRFVDLVLPDAPLRITEEFMNEHKIDFVIHGADTPDAERQAMYDVPIGRGQYTEVPRTEGISTTDIIDRVASRLAVDYDEHALPSDRQPVVAVVRDVLL